MFRTLALSAALAFAPAAFACGGDCDGNCSHKHEADEGYKADFDAAKGTKLVLAVSGMTCGSCSGKITAALTALDGVNVALVDHETGEARVAYDAAKLDNAKLIEAIVALGFTASEKVDEA
jgi:copper chaperone CopZ